jgi:hypothetical protein
MFTALWISLERVPDMLRGHGRATPDAFSADILEIPCKNSPASCESKYMRVLPFLLASSFFLATQQTRAQAPTPPTLYPFVHDGKWGYISAEGAWMIEPRFDRCIEMFEGDRVRVWQGKHWGYIDRAGKWIAKPEFTEPILGSEHASFEVVSDGTRQGILAHSGKVILPPTNENVVLSGDRAWVRRSGKLGVFALDGHWILKPSIPWPQHRDMPVPTDDGVAWFKEGKKWGLFSPEGKVLFSARFAEHEMGRKEVEEWNRPEGVDFKNERAWVYEGNDCLLISAEGKVLVRQPNTEVRRWNDNLYVTTTKEGQRLISGDGEAILPGTFALIGTLTDGIAVVVQQSVVHHPDGSVNPLTSYGYIDAQGHIIVEPGDYAGPRRTAEYVGVFEGFSNVLLQAYPAALLPFSEGLAPVRDVRRKPGPPFSARTMAGYIDRTGALAIPTHFDTTEPFSNGLGAIEIDAQSGSWGFVDKDGKVVIAPQFAGVTPFCRDRAWVTKDQPWNHPKWAMIDRDGRVLTDFRFVPPEQVNGWHYMEGDKVLQSRWRGDLAMVTESEFHNGLATADGRMLAPAIYNRIGELHDGVAVAAESRPIAGTGDINWVTSLLTERGETLVAGVYTEISDFDDGFAWASHRWTDHRGPYQHEGWGLIDTSAHEQTELKYIKVWWVWPEGETFTDSSCPHYTGELAPVTLADGYQQYGQKGGAEVWDLNNWGYINRTGKIVAWHNKSSGK